MLTNSNKVIIITLHNKKAILLMVLFTLINWCLVSLSKSTLTVLITCKDKKFKYYTVNK